MNGAGYIAAFLAAKNVRTAFGYPGMNIIELYDALSGGPVQNIICRHEQGAICAAIGYAKASGNVGVCFATSGPGAANLMTGIEDANLDSVPLLVVTGQVARGAIGRDAFQEADVLGMTIPITKHNYLVRTGTELPDTLEEAWIQASAHRRGPVLIDIAHDVFSEEIAQPVKIHARPPKQSSEFPLGEAVPQLRNALSHAERPMILAGGGIIADGADDALAAFARATGIPVAVTLMARGSLIGGDPEIRYLGFAGQAGHAAANRALAECDLLIASGTRFSDRTIVSPQDLSKKFVFHNDIDAAEISKNIRADAAAVCGCRAFFEAALGATGPDLRFSDWTEPFRSEPAEPEAEGLSMRRICDSLSACAKRAGGVMFVTDVGENQMAAASSIESVIPRGFLTSGGLGTMGFGLPGAIGASFACADFRSADVKQIVIITGDGGFQMTEQELSTLAYAPLPVKIFLLDNGGLGMLRSDQRAQSFTLYGNPDFAMLAGAYGIRSLTLDSVGQIDAVVQEAIGYHASLFVHCRV